MFSVQCVEKWQRMTSPIYEEYCQQLSLFDLKKKKGEMTFSEKLKTANKFVEMLNCGEYAVIVEGKRDVIALRNIGVNCIILQATGKPEMVVNKIVGFGKKPLILFDFDEAGKEREKRLTELLFAVGLSPDNVSRGRFRRVFGLRFCEDVDTKYDELSTKSAIL